MRLLFVVQRYGRDVPGGAELCCREFATRLAARGHDVQALTSCARSYVDWANVYPQGAEDIDGVTVHRLPVDAPRSDRFFGPLNARVPYGRKPIPLYLQREWMRKQGPYLHELVPWLWSSAAGFDAVVFFTYLYYTTWAGLPAAAGLAPSVLHPTAHDEPPLYLSLFDATFSHASALAFLTEEEAALVHHRFRARRPGSVVGMGLDPAGQVDVDSFRRKYGLGDRPYVVFVGRIDPHKGSEELFQFFVAYKQRNPGPLALVVVGEPVRPLPPDRDVVLTGFVDESTKASAIAGALALVQPSYYESFSIVLVEAWSHGRAALVNGRCAVLDGQARRSNGAIPYRGFAEFEAGLDLLVERPALRRALGEAGRDYVDARYRWPVVLDEYEALLARATRGRPARAPQVGARAG
jgi:glycosyltransferase involved in cell wall biosynthesis